MNEVECTCGYEWGVHSSWCAMSAYVIRDTEPAMTDEELAEQRYYEERFMMAESLNTNERQF